MFNMPKRSIRVGDNLMTFKETMGMVYCGFEEVVSLQPLQLKRVQPPEGKSHLQPVHRPSAVMGLPWPRFLLTMFNLVDEKPPNELGL
jgi:hypothetical protein